jgi:rSAM/selenodomain-associated transferase 2
MPPTKEVFTLKVSIIIPTFNEALILEDSLRAIFDLNPYEIIVADGGSNDRTLSVARRMATHVITSRTGRAEQMNAGAKKATGNLLLFMHADNKLPKQSFKKMTEIMQLASHAGGAFSLQIESKKISLKIIASLATWRSKYLNLVYGDQAIFVRADIFRNLGGFSSLPICEDLEFFRRLRRQGEVILLKEKTHTSARRWANEGTLQTTLRNITIVSLFLFGFPPNILSKWYSVIR